MLFIQYYGIAPIEVIYEMYRQKVKDSIDEMIGMLWEMPVDIVESCLFTMDKLGMEGWPKENPLYSEKGIFVHLQLFEDAEFDYLLRQQMDKDFYIPSAQQIDEICRIGYEASSSAYKKLESFFIKKLKFSYEQAVTWCLQVWANSYEGESPSKIINKMTEANIEFEEKMINELLELLVAAHNNRVKNENNAPSIFFFCSIGEMGLQNYKDKVNHLTEAQLLEDLEEQIHANSKICSKKAKWYNKGIKLLVSTIILWFICMTFQLI